jgi:hypothetical protein
VKFNHDLHILIVPALFEDFTSVDAAAPAATIQRQIQRKKTINKEGVVTMISTLKRWGALWMLMATVLFALVPPAFSQQPTDAQRSAIRSACRSDYQAHCASVPPGGIESLQCLQKSMSSLSSSCQTAVGAVKPPAASNAESTPATGPAKPAAETAAAPAAEAATATPAKKPSSAQVAAIRLRID